MNTDDIDYFLSLPDFKKVSEYRKTIPDIKEFEELLLENMSGKMFVFSSSMPKEEREKLFQEMIDL